MARRFVRPYLEIWIDLWIIQVHTDLMTQNVARYTEEWVLLHITIFHKWGFRFRLYCPYRRRMEG
jgi:hypothetical protein